MVIQKYAGSFGFYDFFVFPKSGIFYGIGLIYWKFLIDRVYLTYCSVIFASVFSAFGS